MNGTVRYYAAFTDQQGSVLSVFDEDGEKVFDATYNAWGRQAMSSGTIGLSRGYTGHEMMPDFGLINMNRRSLARSGKSNGRLYDPTLGRFLSSDNYVQEPDNSQSFNRYSYGLNNPLKLGGRLFWLFGITFYFPLYPGHQHGHGIRLFLRGQLSSWRYVVPLVETASTTAGGGMLGTKYGVTPHGGLLAVVGYDGRRQSLGHKVSRMLANGVHAFLGDVVPVGLREVEATAEGRLGQPIEKVGQVISVTVRGCHVAWLRRFFGKQAQLHTCRLLSLRPHDAARFSHVSCFHS